MPLDGKAPLTRAAIDLLFRNHARAALAFSGGADSSVLLDLCQPYRDQVAVLWCNTGYMLPHVEQHVRDVASGGPFVELRSDLQAHWRERGIPSSVVPVDHMTAAGIGGTYAVKEPKIQPWPACCHVLRTLPIFQWLADHPEVTLLLHGQRDRDRGTIGKADGGGLAVRAPLAAWLDDDMNSYIEEHRVPLPRHYTEGVRDSFECWCCPAMSDEGAPVRVAYLKEHYPALYEQVAPVVERVNEAVQGAAKRYRERSANV